MPKNTEWDTRSRIARWQRESSPTWLKRGLNKVSAFVEHTAQIQQRT